MLRIIGLSFVVFCVTFSTHAFGPTGHRTVGEIASRHLTPEAVSAVKALLGNEFMAEASTWPDEMRSNPEPFWQRESQSWHYINLPDGVNYEDSQKNPNGDALTALANFAATLKNVDAPKKDRQLALRFIIHLVGDLHQPLHAGRASDWGGNRIDVVFFEEMSNLHKVWDEDLIDRVGLSFTEWTRFLDAKVTPTQITEWQKATPADWAAELITLRSDVYAVENSILSYGYVYKHMPLIKSQLSKGGIRLAGYLNALFIAK